MQEMKYKITVYLTNGDTEEFICKHWHSDSEYGYIFSIDNSRNGKWIVPASSILCFYSEEYKDEDN